MTAEVTEAPFVWTAAAMSEALFKHFAGQSYAVLTEVTTHADESTWDLLKQGVPAVEAQRRGASRRIDLLALRKADPRHENTRGPLDVLAIEVKVSRSDFLSDVKNPHKQLPWRRLSHRHAYAVPAGLVHPDEVPPESGLLEVRRGIERHGGQVLMPVSWRRKARYDGRRVDLPPTFMATVAYRASWAEARVKGWSWENLATDSDPETMRAELVRLRREVTRLGDKATREHDSRLAYKALAAAATGGVPCRDCAAPVKPVSMKGGWFSKWAHADKAAEAVCEPLRVARGEAEAARYQLRRPSWTPAIEPADLEQDPTHPRED